jgi:chorismate dehydratase
MDPKKPEGRYRFAAAYANSAPLTHFLHQVDSRVVLLEGPPATLAARVLSGELDAALIPVVDYLTQPALRMIEDLGVCSDGHVESVLLKCRRPIREVRSVELDPTSHTSNALIRVLLHHHFHLSPQIGLPVESRPADAAVVIGDRALCSKPAPGGDYDLAAEWKKMTGLPFVFAVWGYRADHPQAQELSLIAQAAKTAGLAALDQLAALQARRLHLPLKRCRTYLGSSIHYCLGPRERQAMDLFAKLLQELDGQAMAPTEATSKLEQR